MLQRFDDCILDALLQADYLIDRCQAEVSSATFCSDHV